MTTKIQQFLRVHPVFTYENFSKALSENATRSPYTIRALLAHHIQHGHIVRIRRGLFASIPMGADPATYSINPYLIASYATNDAVIAYHTALSFYNLAYSTSYRFLYLTKHQARKFTFRSENYESVTFPPILLTQQQENAFVNNEDVQGLDIRVTSLERTCVDVLDKPMLGGGWEEIWRSLEMIDHLKIENVVEYALLLGKATTIAKVGFYLSCRQKELGIKDEALERLRLNRPRAPHYIDSSARKDGKFLPEWNIIVPKNLLIQNWQE